MMKKMVKSYNGTAIISFTKEEKRCYNLKIGDFVEVNKLEEGDSVENENNE